MRIGSAEVEGGTELADRAGASLASIATAVTETKAAVERITLAVGGMGAASASVLAASDGIAAIAARTNDGAGLMTRSANEVTHSVDSIAAVSEENSAAAEQVSAATEELSAQVEEVVASAATLSDMASRLDKLVGRFKLAGSESLLAQVDVFRKAHLKWVERVNGLLAGRDKWTAADVPDHHGCSLGKWYDSVGKGRFGSFAAFAAIEPPHAQFHAAVRATVTKHDAGDRNGADLAASDVLRLSGEVVRALEALGSEAMAGGTAGHPRSVPDRRARAA